MPSFRFLATLACGLSLWTAAPCQAGSGPFMTLPMGGVKPKSGLTMQIDGRGVDANGYRPVRVEIFPTNGAPFPADRQLRILLRPTGYNYTGAGVPEVSQIIELPEGQTTVTASIAMPQMGVWSVVEITTYEDGEKLNDLSVNGISWNTSGYWDWTEARPTILVIDSDVPSSTLRMAMGNTFRSRGTDPNPTYKLSDVTVLSNIFPDPNRGQLFAPGTPRPTDLALLSQVDQMQRLELLPPAELPARWIELSQYDVAMISLEDLRSMTKSQPQQLAALREWAASGPLLIVYGVGDEFDGLSELELLLKLPRLPAEEGEAGYQGWTPADPARHLPALQADLEDLAYAQSGVATSYGPYGYGPKAYIKPKPTSPGDDKPLPSPAEPPFLLRPNGVGTLVAIASDKPFPGAEEDWKWIFNCVSRNHWSWYQRNGFSLHRANNDYWTFLIPGVGQAPVLSFLLFVSMFAVVIGPLNYMFLNRARRLYLLLVTVPVGAAVVTLGLFGYALVTDGLGVRLRARSFTDLDQRTGQAVAWSRQTYYASIAPSRGLVFPEDCTIFPVISEPEGRPGNSGRRQVLTWSDGQNLRTGYIDSRTQGQFMIQRVTTAQEQLVVKEGVRAAEAPQATNELGARIRFVLLRDSRGNYFASQNLAADASQALAATTPAAAEAKLLELYREHPLENPRGYDPNAYNSLLSELMPNYSWVNVDASSSSPVMATGLLESNLVVASRPSLHPPHPRTYVAVIDRSPVVPYGVPRARQQASLHVIRGRY